MDTHVVPVVSKSACWIGRTLSAVALLFLLFDSVIKLLVIAPVVESFARLGFPAEVAFGVGVLELVCTLAYLWPRTSLHGAILLTGYLGGAVATHLRLLDPWFSHTLFPVYVGACVWGGLLLRDPRARLLVAPRGAGSLADTRRAA